MAASFFISSILSRTSDEKLTSLSTKIEFHEFNLNKVQEKLAAVPLTLYNKEEVVIPKHFF
jgi:hypothetical protein